ncbi:ABC transporter substrate-binding protein [Marinobacter xestospongiae]|uniref:ABC transporter substrate-binding protein n=1 Tax=Marinobacter xestospongiae TaxID=994319 RepID=A0ABU3VY49_9GAMM|nr:ABC transporter substrate-binding protein [Marinobacter xestospongiae]MDV2079213.1 ABC transporter substrate-binding protein [Marinobacter xestospongiae]
MALPRFLSAVLLSLLLVCARVEARVTLGVPAAQADVQVGCLFPLDGRGGLYGKDSLVGIRLALEWLEQQETPYPSLHIMVEDSRSRVSRAVRLVRGFVREDNARFLCGVVNSAIAWAVSQVAESERAFFIGTDHASTRLTEAPVSPYYFRVNNNIHQSMTAAAAYIRDRFPLPDNRPLRLSYLGPDYDYGYRMWRDFRDALTDQGVDFEIVTVLWPRLYEPNYAPYIHALTEQPADLVVNALWGGDLVAFVQQANQTPLFQRTRVANFDTGGNYEVLAALGENMPSGLILSARHHNNWPQTAYNRWFVQRFHELSGRYPSYAAEGAYAGILAIAEAIQTAGTDASDADVQRALEHLQLKLPEDPPGFTSFMDPDTHQLQQVISIGTSTADDGLPPASKLLNDWYIHYPPSNSPTSD